jgi:D-sedoheptulose 7-phosphate isomerase
MGTAERIVSAGEPAGMEELRRQIAEHREILATTEAACAAPLLRLVQIAASALSGGGKILFFGNGGSAADAQHLAAELTVRFIRDRRALAALALTADSSALTACGNDLGFELVFARQIEALGRPGDVAVGFSTSGASRNVIRALETARSMGLTAAAFSGCGGGRLAGLADPQLIVPAQATARIQEMHGLLGHVFCAGLERELGIG